ncbi:MAG: S41 family peptidase [Patescibacteria group bacterium]
MYEVNSQYVKNKKSNKLKKIAWVIIILLLMTISFGSGLYISGNNEIIKDLAREEVVYLGQVIGKYNEPKAGILTQDIDFNLYWEVWDALKKDYVDKEELNEKELFYGSLKGLVAAIGDPYTVFMDPKIAQEFEDDLAGTFEGIGAEIGIRDEVLTIVAPLADMPSEKAGLQSGDKIYAINGESTAGISIDEAVQKIRGPKGTEVTLTISRDGFEQAEDFTITREQIIVKSVRTEMKENNIFYIKITNFNDDTLDLFNRAVRDVLAKNPSGLIIDLRNNPGGYLDTAIEVSSEWIDEGVIVIEQFSNEKKNDYLSRGRARLKEYSTVVLVNQGSASASEIVAGALRDYEKATIVGMQTFGKGSVQSLSEFNDGSSVKITVAKWLTPNGDCINEEGIAPDIEVGLTIEEFKEGKDPQLDKAIEILSAGVGN